jgi:hypothetical protein
MGCFGRLIGQNDSVADLIVELKDGDISIQDLALGDYYCFESLDFGDSTEDDENLDAEYFDAVLFATALVLESVNKGSVNKHFYGHEGSSVVDVLSSVPEGCVDAQAVQEVKKRLPRIVNVIKKAKKDFIADTMEHETLFDAFGVPNKPTYANRYLFYKAAINNLVEGFKGVNLSKIKKVSSGRLVTWNVSNYECEEVVISGLIPVPSMNVAMSRVGYRDVLKLETEAYDHCTYLAKVSSVDERMMKFLKSMCFINKQEYYKRCGIDLYEFEGRDTTLYDNAIECIVTISNGSTPDVISVDMNSGYLPIQSKEVPRVEFESCSGEFASLFKAANHVLDKYSALGVAVDKLVFYISYFMFTDMDKASGLVWAEGISRVFDNNWEVDAKPQPITTDTYEAIVFFGIPKDNPVDVCCLRAYALKMLQGIVEDGECDPNNSFIQSVARSYNIHLSDDVEEACESLSEVCEGLIEELEACLCPKKNEKGYGSGASTACISDTSLYNHYNSLVV